MAIRADRYCNLSKSIVELQKKKKKMASIAFGGSSGSDGTIKEKLEVRISTGFSELSSRTDQSQELENMLSLS